MKKLKLKKGYLKGGLTDSGAHSTAYVKGQEGQAEQAAPKAPLSSAEQAALDTKNAKIAAGITGGLALTTQAATNKSTSIGESALSMGAMGAGTGAAIGGPVGAAIGAGAGILVGTTTAVINQKKAARERAKKSAAANRFIGNILTDQKQASSAYSTDDSTFNQFTGVNSFVSPEEFIGVQNGMAKGGVIKGKGGPKDDAIDAKVKAGSFIVPAENKPVAKAIGVNMLGHSPNQKAKVKQSSGADVKLSNEEYLFTPKEKNKLINKGIDLNQLAPNSDSPIAGRAIVNKGKKMGGTVTQGRAIVNGYKGGGETVDGEETTDFKALIKKGKSDFVYRDANGNVITKEQFEKSRKKWEHDMKLSKYFADVQKKGRAIKDTLGLKELQNKNINKKENGVTDKMKADFDNATKALQAVKKNPSNYNKSQIKAVVNNYKRQKELIGYNSNYQNTSANESTEMPVFKKQTVSNTQIPLVTANGKVTSGTAPVSTATPTTVATATTVPATATTPTSTKGTGATKKASARNTTPVTPMVPLASPQLATGFVAPTIATPTQIAAIDAKNKAALAPPPGQFASTIDLLGGPASIAAMGQIGIGLINNIGNDRPVDTMPGELTIRLTDAIQDEAKLDQQATFGIEQKQKNKVLNDIENNRVQALNAVTSTTGGDGTAMTAIRGAAVDKNNADLAAKDEMIKNQKLGVAVAAGARADQLATTKAEYKRKMFEDTYNAFQQNQEANGQLINAGITNFVGNLGQKSLVKELAAMKDNNTVDYEKAAKAAISEETPAAKRKRLEAELLALPK